MNNPNPFLPQGSFFEQKNKARARLKIAVFFSISLSVMALMALLIQGCRKPNDTTADNTADTNSIPELPTNPPDVGSTSTAALPPETNPPAPLPVPPPAPVAPVPQTEDYTVIKGDTFASIAKKSGVSVRAVQDANPGVDPRKLKIGQKLHLPPAASASTSAAPGTAPMAADTASSGGELTYKVKSGDTLTSIARHFHVSIKALESANNLTTTSIRVGRTLKIPGSAAPASAPAPAETAPSAPTSAPAPASPAPGT
jgi:LysM repeat protein